MSNLAYPHAGALKVAATVQTLMAMSKIRLFKSNLTITPSIDEAALVAAECDYDGYVALTVTAFLAPYLDPAGGASIQSGTQQFQYGPVGTPPVINQVYGFWVETAAAVPILAGSFDNPVSMAQIGDAIPISVVLNYGTIAGT